jgi:hypothetical protein
MSPPQGTGRSPPASRVSCSYALAAEDSAAAGHVKVTIKKPRGAVKNNFPLLSQVPIHSIDIYGLILRKELKSQKK